MAARAAILIDRQTGMTLWEQNADTPLPMASTTKIMAAMVTLDHGQGKLNEPVTVSEHAFATGGSSVFAAGDVVTLGDLLKASLLRSSNEATVAAAEYLAGDEATFIGWMNDKARDLGLRHTHFMNPHGFYRNGGVLRHYSSARDLALLTRHALTYYPLIRQIITMAHDRSIQIPVIPRGPVVLDNHNKIVNEPVPGIPGAIVDGVKTGYMLEAGKCYVSSATLDNWQLIAVVLNTPTIWQDARTLFYYGFRHYEWRTYADERPSGLTAAVSWGAQSSVPVGVRGVLGAPVLKPEFGGMPDTDQVVFVGSRLNAPVRQGTEVGTLEVRRDGQVIATAPAIALEGMPRAWWWRALAMVAYWVLVLAALLLIGRIYGARAKVARRRRRRLQATRGGIDFGGASQRER